MERERLLRIAQLVVQASKLAKLVWSLKRQAASLLSDVQAGLRDTPVEDLLDDGRELIRQSPRLTIGVAVLAGFVVARLVKSSAR